MVDMACVSTVTAIAKLVGTAVIANKLPSAPERASVPMTAVAAEHVFLQALRTVML